MKGNKKHGTHGIRLQLLLLVLLVISGSVMIGTSFAKYVSSGYYTGNARVSPFVIESSVSGSTDLKLDPENPSDSFSFSVTNSSNRNTCEVAAEYDVIIHLPKPLNGEVQMHLMRGDQEVPHYSVSEDGCTYMYDAGAFQAAQEDTHQFELVFRAENGITQAFDLNGIRICAYAVQVD